MWFEPCAYFGPNLFLHGGFDFFFILIMQLLFFFLTVCLCCYPLSHYQVFWAYVSVNNFMCMFMSITLSLIFV